MILCFHIFPLAPAVIAINWQDGGGGKVTVLIHHLETNKQTKSPTADFLGYLRHPDSSVSLLGHDSFH